MRQHTSCINTAKSLLFPPLLDTVAIAYGREKEDIARKELSEFLRKETPVNGLFIDEDNPIFGASLDRLIDDDGIVEIKNPFCAKDLSPKEGMEKYPHINFIDKRTQKMKQTHHWYYQIQGQLHVTKRKYCVFSLRTSLGMETTVVERNDEFWKKEMEPMLTAFYEHCLLPEIIDSRFLRSMPIRDPSYILEAKRKLTNRKLLNNHYSDQNADQIKKNSNSGNDIKKEVSEKSNDPRRCSDDDDDVRFVSCYANPHPDIKSMKNYFENKGITANDVKAVVLDEKQWLNDDAMDLFLEIIRESTDFETQSIMYQYYPAAIQPANSTKSIVFLGGPSTNHWRLGYYNGSIRTVYNTIRNYTGGRLVEEETNYVLKRFPTIVENNVHFAKIKCSQPDNNSCGVYAAALATYMVLTADPSKINFSKKVSTMRHHFQKILEDRQLSQFPIIK